jgi:hypothetical protein
MIKFTLTSSTLIEEDLQANVCLKPSSSLIEDYIATYKVYDTEAEAISDNLAFISTMTPILFSQFENMDNIPLELRQQFEL